MGAKEEAEMKRNQPDLNTSHCPHLSVACNEGQQAVHRSLVASCELLDELPGGEGEHADGSVWASECCKGSRIASGGWGKKLHTA